MFSNYFLSSFFFFFPQAEEDKYVCNRFLNRAHHRSNLNIHTFNKRSLENNWHIKYVNVSDITKSIQQIFFSIFTFSLSDIIDKPYLMIYYFALYSSSHYFFHLQISLIDWLTDKPMHLGSNIFPNRSEENILLSIIIIIREGEKIKGT